jgi:hypothetical protein
MPEFAYTELLPLGPDHTEYRLLTTDGVSTIDTLPERSCKSIRALSRC